jgi:phenylacetate-CoA ligase
MEVSNVSSKYWVPEIETLPRDDWRHSTSPPAHTVHSAYHNSAYYGRAMRSAGFDPDSIRTLRDIRKLPFVNKKFERDRQEQCPHLGTTSLCPMTK